MNNNEYFSKLDNIDNLPTLPVIAQKIQQLIFNDRSNISQISTIIARDQAISTKVIRLINSAYFGLQHQVSSIQQAIVLLGLNAVHNIVLGVSIIKTFSESTHGSIFDRQLFWAHSVSTAICSQTVAKELHLENPEDFFIAGLLHDIGILVFDQFFHEDFVNVLNILIEAKTEILSVEKEIFGFNHEETGAYLAHKWKLPDMIINSIQNHHRFDNSVENQFEKINTVVHLSDHLSMQAGVNYGFRMYYPSNIPETARLLDMSIDQIESIWSTVSKDLSANVKDWINL